MATPAGCMSLSTTTRLVRCAAPVGDLVDAADAARADIDLAAVAARHRARTGHAGGPDLGLEAGRQLEVGQRNFARRRGCHAPRVRCELRSGLVRRTTLLPCRRRSSTRCGCHRWGDGYDWRGRWAGVPACDERKQRYRR